MNSVMYNMAGVIISVTSYFTDRLNKPNKLSYVVHLYLQNACNPDIKDINTQFSYNTATKTNKNIDNTHNFCHR